MFKYVYALIVSFFKTTVTDPDAESCPPAATKVIVMPTPEDDIQHLADLDAEKLAAVDERVKAKLNDPNFKPELIARSHDPFGMDWKWLDAESEDDESA